MTSTLSYLLNIPVPFSNIGFPILSFFPANSSSKYIQDSLHQIHSFLSLQAPQYSRSLTALIEKNHFQQTTINDVISIVQSIQINLNQSSIHWNQCYISCFFLLGIGGWFVINDSFQSKLFTMKRVVNEFLFYFLTISMFTSYRLILSPLWFSLTITCFLCFKSILFLPIRELGAHP